MISLHSTGSAAETSAASTLLAIIADPAAAKKRLAELVTEKQAALDAEAAAKDMTEAINKRHAEVDAKHAEAARITGEHKVRTAQLNEQAAFHAQAEKRLADYEAAVSAREAEMTKALADREASVKAREGEVASRETALRITEQKAQAMKEAYERKLGALQNAVSA